MGWVSEEAQERASWSRRPRPESTAAQRFDQAAERRWKELLQEIRGDVDDFKSQGGSAAFRAASDTECDIACETTGIVLTLNFDPGARTIQYEYSSGRAQAAPEGGILSMRLSRYRRAELYSSDEHLTSEEARRLLLEPLFFPPGEETLAA